MYFKSLAELVRFRKIFLKTLFRDCPENHDLARKMKNYTAAKIWRPHQSLPKGNK
jgi:hypothetical protein